ncbi:MAG: mechanosensitive ion channel [Bdellovibrionales bacterium]|nr:mechanosensitive ion channel [Bdellovibrionales bacterium]
MNDANLDQVASIAGLFSFSKLFFLLLGVTLLGVVARVVANFGTKVHGRYPSKRLLIAQVVTVLSFLIYILGGGYIFFGVVNPPKALLLTVSGTLAVALGLSMKDLVASVVAGLILIFDRPFQVGDRVTYDGMYGEVATIGLRAVRLVTLDDSTITIPNNRFLSDAVTSGNSGALDMMIEVDFHVDLASNLREVSEILYETAATSRYVFLKKPVNVVMTELAIANRIAMQARLKCYVIDVRFEKTLQTDLLVRGNEALIKAGVSRPTLSLMVEGAGSSTNTEAKS